jgi:hypothetical protein
MHYTIYFHLCGVSAFHVLQVKKKLLNKEQFFHVGPCIYKPNSVRYFHANSVVPIYLGPALLQGSSGTLRLLGARPCTQVRILPFHPRITAGLSCKLLCGTPSLSIWASLLAPLWLPTTGVTRYPSAVCTASVRTFLTILANGADTQHKAI